MKRCPTCNRTFTESNLSFCIDDGTPLVIVPEEDDERTRVTQPYGKAPQGNWSSAPEYQPPSSYTPPGGKGQRSSWPWVLGILAVVLIAIVGFGVAAAIIIPRVVRNSRNQNQPVASGGGNENSSAANSNQGVISGTNTNINTNTNTNSNTNLNSNLNTNSNTNDNTNTQGEPMTLSADPDKVLAELKDLENDWTVANINADKKALERILADDYVGVSDGRAQGKAEYLGTIKRDTSISHWEFSDLKLNLKGDRATLSGIITLTVNGRDVKLRFTDKFVWRDDRWQATASEVSQLQ